MSELTVRNRQRAHKIDMRPLRQIALFLIEDQLGLGDY